ncbi:MAG: PorV/PorQ family protein [Candidatus Zixiibacteriota bacterium]
MKFIVAIICLALSLLAGSPTLATGDAGQETPFLSLGVGARSLGLGGAYAALSNDATAIHYNPAGLADMDYQEVALMHSILIEGTIYDFVSWAYPITENHGVGAGVMRIGTDDIIRREDFADRGRFDFAYTQIVLGYGRNLGERLAAGLSLEIFQQSLDNNSDFGTGLDAGINVRLWRNLRLSAVAHEILRHELILVERAEKSPLVIQTGLSWAAFELSDHASVTAAVDLEKQEERNLKTRSGVEVTLHDALALRAGYDRDNFAGGVGLKAGRIKVDYAYKMVDYTDGIHHISLSFLLGKPTDERIRLRELAKLPPEPTEEEKRFAGLMDTANRYFRRFQLDSAAAYFQMALEMQPDNGEIIGTLAAIEESRRVQQAQEEALRAAREDVLMTLKTFVAQAEQMLSHRMYRAALDLLDLIFDIDPANTEANQLRDRIVLARDAEVTLQLESASRAARSGKWFEAMEAYNRVLELDSASVAAQQGKLRAMAEMDLPERVRQGMELFEKGDLAGARARFQAVLEVNPNEPTAQEYLRRISSRLPARPAATLEDLQKDRVYWELYLEGMRHMRNKDYQRAIEVWEKVLEAYPNNANTIDNIEQARLRLGTQSPTD